MWIRKSGRSRQGVDPGHGLLERGGHALLVRVLAEPDVAVADLDEREAARPRPARLPWPNARDERTPPPAVQTSPVPAQAMHLRNPRRSTPSCPRDLGRSCSSTEETPLRKLMARIEPGRASGMTIRYVSCTLAETIASVNASPRCAKHDERVRCPGAAGKSSGQRNGPPIGPASGRP